MSLLSAIKVEFAPWEGAAPDLGSGFTAGNARLGGLKDEGIAKGPRLGAKYDVRCNVHTLIQ